MRSKNCPDVILNSIEEERRGVEWLRCFAEHCDRQALADFFVCYHSRVYGFCRCVLRRSSDAEDATQATFVAVMRHADKYASIRSIKLWLFGLARNACTSKARSEQRRAHRERTAKELRPEARFKTPQLAAEYSEAKDSLHVALDHLPDKIRTIFFMRYSQDMSHRQIAETLGMNEATVRSSVARGLQQLKVKLSFQGINGIPVYLATAFAALEAQAPADLARSLVSLSKTSMNLKNVERGDHYRELAPLSLWSQCGRRLTRILWVVSSVVIVAFAVGGVVWQQMPATQSNIKPSVVDDVARDVLSPTASIPEATSSECYWDFNNKNLKGLNIIFGNWSYGARRRNKKDGVLQFERQREQKGIFGTSSSILLTPSHLNLRPPVLLTFKAGTDYLDRITNLSLFARGAYWAEKSTEVPPRLEDHFFLEDLVGKKKEKDLSRGPRASSWKNYTLYITKTSVISVEDNRVIHRYRMKKSWAGRTDRLYIFWILMRGPMQLDNLYLKQLTIEELPACVGAI